MLMLPLQMTSWKNEVRYDLDHQLLLLQHVRQLMLMLMLPLQMTSWKMRSDMTSTTKYCCCNKYSRWCWGDSSCCQRLVEKWGQIWPQPPKAAAATSTPADAEATAAFCKWLVEKWGQIWPPPPNAAAATSTPADAEATAAFCKWLVEKWGQIWPRPPNAAAATSTPADADANAAAAND
jgi:predicted RNase H-like HicB family nuclease